MRIRTVFPHEFHLVLDLLEQAFPDVSRSFFHSISLYDPWQRDGLGVAVEVNNQLVSFLQIFDRTMRINSQPVRFGGIGSVGTHPHHAGKGYASLLLQHAQKVMTQEGMAGGLLFTKIQPFYEKLGWKTLHLHEQHTAIDAIQKLPSPGYACRPFKDNDLDAVHAIYENEQSFISGTMQRNLVYWQKRTHWMNHICRVIVHQDEIVGYFYGAKYREHIPTLHITEYGLKYHDRATAASVLTAAAQLANELNCTTLCGNFLIHPVYQSVFHHYGIQATPSPYNYIMWLDTKLPGIFNELSASAAKNNLYYWQTDAF